MQILVGDNLSYISK